MRSSSDSTGTDSISRIALRFAVFCVPLILLFIILEWVMANVPNSYSAKRDQLQSLANEIDTLIVGSSQANFGIVPAHLSGSAYNLANTAESLYYTDQLLTKVVPRLPNLRRVVITLGYISPFFRFKRGDWEDWRQYYYQREWHIPPEQPEDRFDVRMWSRVALCDWHIIYESLCRGFQALCSGRQLCDLPSMDNRGWTERIGTVDPRPEAAAVTLARHHSLMHDHNASENLIALEHALTFLQKQKIEVTLVTMPVWHSYADGMDQDRWRLANTAYERLARKYGARYFCFLQLSQLTREDFYDTDHFNPKGAVRFTEMLNTELERAKHPGKPPQI